MKKIIMSFMAFILCAILSAREIKTYITIAYNYGLFTEKAENVKTDLSTNGVDLSISTYFNDNWGLYLNTDYNFPTKATATSGGISLTVTNADWDFSMLLSAFIGPTYKYKINEHFELLGAFCFHLAQYSMTSTYSSTLNYSFGIAGDIGIRYLATERIYLAGGCLLSRDFYYNGKINTGYGTVEDKGSYNLGSFRPYIGIGISFNETIK